MTIKQAIEKAIDGGYDYGELFDTLVTPHKRIVGDDGGLILLEDDGIVIGTLDKEKYLLSPEFWMSLGKAMGWGGDVTRTACDHHEVYICNDCNLFFETYNNEKHPEIIGYRHVGCPEGKEYISRWHSFVDHLADRGTPESFFEIV